MSTPMRNEHLVMYTVYRHPRDYPGKWVVRQWVIGATSRDSIAALKPSIVADTLEEARSIVPPGLVKMKRWAGDDPVIYEVWL